LSERGGRRAARPTEEGGLPGVPEPEPAATSAARSEEGGPDRRAERAERGRRDGVLVTLLAFVVAIVVGGILIALSDADVRGAMGYFFAAPADFFSFSWYAIRDAYSALFQGAIVNFGSISAAANGTGTTSAVFRPISETIVTATPLICAGLSVSLAFRSGLFNIGGEGQVVAGAIASAYVGFAWHLPVFLHLVVAIAAGIAGGAAWGLIPGFLKARTGAHEVITTIMLNYVAGYLLLYLLSTHAIQRPNRSDAISREVDGSARLPHLAGAQLRVHFGIFLALAAAAAVAWLLSRSTLGFRLRAVGSNPDAARTAGMNVERTYMLAMVLAGALAGLAGVNQSLGTSYTLTPGISANIGFDAITVALLGRASPWGTVLAGLLFGALRAGGVQMQAQTGTPIDVVTVIQALVVIFIAAPPLIRAIFRLKSAGTGAGQTLAKGWNG
jgi:general nucleoside transport system permease protein